jgi:hypothetical protein
MSDVDSSRNPSLTPILVLLRASSDDLVARCNLPL